jgi:hypothetical protein
MADKPFSQACANNQEPILIVLKRVFASAESVLEIGSGTGQHAVHFGRGLPHVHWQTSDLAVNHAGIRQWLDEAALPNVAPPLNLDVRSKQWPDVSVHGVFSANTAHILSWEGVIAMFAGVAEVLSDAACFALYGPFNYAGAYTSPGNERFDAQLKARDPLSGIRDFEAVTALAQSFNLRFVEDNPMPASNRLLVWRRMPPAR